MQYIAFFDPIKPGTKNVISYKMLEKTIASSLTPKNIRKPEVF